MFQILMKRNNGAWLNLYEINLSEVEVSKKNIKELSKATVYKIFKKLEKVEQLIEDHDQVAKTKFLTITMKKLFKEDNILSAENTKNWIVKE